MEAVHKPEKRAWIDPTVINVKQFITEWGNTLPSENGETSNVRCLEDVVSEEEYLDIENKCGLTFMKSEHQDLVEPSNRVKIPKNVDLLTVRTQADELKKRADSSSYTASVYHNMRTTNYPPLKNLSSLTDLSKIPFEPVTFPDVVLCVQTFLPERRVDPNSGSSSRNKTTPPFQLDQEFLVLGNQYLTELRDKIFCISDKAVPYEMSECPTDEPHTTCEDLYKSGFFFINGVFYNDMRDKDCRDYSETIINWASKGNRGIGPFKKAIMEKTRFIDLNIQLGYPYVYTHQGDCEHLIVFSDLRLLSKHDVSNRNAYPLYVQVKPAKRIFCFVCHEYTASWVVTDNKRLPENPFFFCKTCFINFNYDTDNQKIGDFKAYYYPDTSNIKG